MTDQAPALAVNRHAADILAAIAKKGGNLSKIARAHGLSATTPSKALRHPCYAGEQAIAAFLGVHPKTIWPTRYDSKGKPRHVRIRKQSNVDMLTKTSQKVGAA